jgi:hypothetical protein
MKPVIQLPDRQAFSEQDTKMEQISHSTATADRPEKQEVGRCCVVAKNGPNTIEFYQNIEPADSNEPTHSHLNNKTDLHLCYSTHYISNSSQVKMWMQLTASQLATN